MKIVDLSRELYHRTPSYPGHPPVMYGVWKTHEESFAESGNVHGLASMFISMVDHAGTHIDAPRHFGKSGISIDEYPLEKCIVPGICIDLRHIAPRAEITPADLEAAFDDEARAAFERMSYSHRKEYADWIEEAKRLETRSRRVAKAVEQIRDGKPQR